jgi:hypothetical protein
MSQPIKTGDYIINYYNHYGARLKDLQDTAECMAFAEDKAESRIIDNDPNSEHCLPVSYTIDRRVKSSLDKGAL